LRTRLLAAFALTCAVSYCAMAKATLDDYQHRVVAAAVLIEELHGAEASNYQPELFIGANLTRVRQMLPIKESVTFGGQDLLINNGWLHESISAAESENSAVTRNEMLAQIAQRLRAVDERIKEIRQKQPSVSDKDADKGRLAEILRRPEYIQTAPESSALERLLERFFRWLSRLVPTPKPLQPGSSNVASGIAQVLVVGVCIAAIAFLIWRYGPRLMQGRRKKKKTLEARVVLGEHLEPDQTAADLLAQADALARNGDLRAAIRKAYIALLCELGDRKLISLAQYKTNRDYLYAVRDKVSLYSSMRKLTSSFELHWYGLVPAGEDDWNNFRNDYHKTLRMGSGAAQ